LHRYLDAVRGAARAVQHQCRRPRRGQRSRVPGPDPRWPAAAAALDAGRLSARRRATMAHPRPTRAAPRRKIDPLNEPRQTSVRPGAPRLPSGRLALAPVVDALLADGMLSATDAERAKVSSRQGRPGGSVHPLVLLANLKLASARVPGTELGLEQLTEWLAGEVGRPYRRIDPTRLDVAGVTDLVSHAYARSHRILPLEVGPDHALVATSEPLALDWLPDVARLLR